MKKNSLLLILFAILFVNEVHSQIYSSKSINFGISAGSSGFSWYKNPTTNSPEYSRSSTSVLISSLTLGFYLMIGNDNFIFIPEIYELLIR